MRIWRNMQRPRWVKSATIIEMENRLGFLLIVSAHTERKAILGSLKEAKRVYSYNYADRRKPAKWKESNG